MYTVVRGARREYRGELKKTASLVGNWTMLTDRYPPLHSDGNQRVHVLGPTHAEN